MVQRRRQSTTHIAASAVLPKAFPLVVGDWTQHDEGLNDNDAEVLAVRR